MVFDMRPDEATALAHITMSYVQRLDRAETRKDVDAIMAEFTPWAKAKGVAPQVREHVAVKARSIAAGLFASRCGLSERSKAMAGDVT